MLDKDKEELYYKIGEDEEITDSEKRETYYSEIENEKAEREWEDNF